MADQSLFAGLGQYSPIFATNPVMPPRMSGPSPFQQRYQAAMRAPQQQMGTYQTNGIYHPNIDPNFVLSPQMQAQYTQLAKQQFTKDTQRQISQLPADSPYRAELQQQATWGYNPNRQDGAVFNTQGGAEYGVDPRAPMSGIKDVMKSASPELLAALTRIGNSQQSWTAHGGGMYAPSGGGRGSSSNFGGGDGGAGADGAAGYDVTGDAQGRTQRAAAAPGGLFGDPLADTGYKGGGPTVQQFGGNTQQGAGLLDPFPDDTATMNRPAPQMPGGFARPGSWLPNDYEGGAPAPKSQPLNTNPMPFSGPTADQIVGKAPVSPNSIPTDQLMSGKWDGPSLGPAPGRLFGGLAKDEGGGIRAGVGDFTQPLNAPLIQPAYMMEPQQIQEGILAKPSTYALGNDIFEQQQKPTMTAYNPQTGDFAGATKNYTGLDNSGLTEGLVEGGMQQTGTLGSIGSYLGTPGLASGYANAANSGLQIGDSGAWGAFAHGGRPAVGQPSIGGEEGKEEFVSDSGKTQEIGAHGPEMFEAMEPGTVIAHDILSRFPKPQHQATFDEPVARIGSVKPQSKSHAKSIAKYVLAAHGVR